jgi:hypothetical protein
MRLLERPAAARRMILARMTSQYDDVYLRARDSRICRSSGDRITSNGLFLGIGYVLSRCQSLSDYVTKSIINTSLYLRIRVLSDGLGGHYFLPSFFCR